MAGYSAQPLARKLGLRAGQTVKLINPPGDYSALVGDIMNHLIMSEDMQAVDFIHFFTNNLEELESTLPNLKTQLKKSGIIWISWYKKSAKMPTELTENIIRDTALAIGLVDVKVCAIDDFWSGLKLVFRLIDR